MNKKICKAFRNVYEQKNKTKKSEESKYKLDIKDHCGKPEHCGSQWNLATRRNRSNLLNQQIELSDKKRPLISIVHQLPSLLMQTY